MRIGINFHRWIHCGIQFSALPSLCLVCMTWTISDFTAFFLHYGNCVKATQSITEFQFFSFVHFTGVISIIGNGCVVLIFTTTKTLRTPSNLFVVNLAFSDFMMMATNAPAMVVNCYHETWHFGGNYWSCFWDRNFT